MQMGGEQKLFSRFTDLRLKQKQEEEELMAMIASESTSAGKLSKLTFKQPVLNKQVSVALEVKAFV